MKADVVQDKMISNQICRVCGGIIVKNGKRKDGVQTYKCTVCGRRCSDTNESSLSSSKLSLDSISNLVTLIMIGSPDWAIAKIMHVNVKTAQFWRDRCIDAANEWANACILSGHVYMDEMFFSSARSGNGFKTVMTADDSHSRRVAMSIAFDSNGNGCCHVYMKSGTPSFKLVTKAFKNKIKRQSQFTHDHAYYYRQLKEKLELVDDPVKFDKNSAIYKSKMGLLNNCCSTIRYNFSCHRGIKLEKLQSYGNLFMYRWCTVRRLGFIDAVKDMFDRVCIAKKSHKFKDSFKKDSIW